MVSCISTTGVITIVWGDSGSSGGGSSTSPTTQEQAAAANITVIDGISGVLDNLVQRASTNTQATIEVTVHGDATISVKHPDDVLTECTIRSALIANGLLSEDGTVSFDGNDARYPNGYRIIVEHNQGYNRVDVEAL